MNKEKDIGSGVVADSGLRKFSTFDFDVGEEIPNMEVLEEDTTTHHESTRDSGDDKLVVTSETRHE